MTQLLVANTSRTSARISARAASGLTRAVFVCARRLPCAAAKAVRRKKRHVPHDRAVARARALRRDDLRGTEAHADRATATACAEIFLWCKF